MPSTLLNPSPGLPGSGLLRSFAHFAASSNSLAERLSPPPQPQRLEDIRLSDAVREALEAPLAVLGLALSPHDCPIPDFDRHLSVDRAGDNCFVEIPRSFLESDDDASKLQVLLLQRTLPPEFGHLIVFTDAPAIHTTYTKGIFRRWQQQDVFDLVEHYDARELEDFKTKADGVKADWLRNVLRLDEGGDGTTPTGAASPAGLLDGKQIGELMGIVSPLFNPVSFELFLQHSLDKNLVDLARAGATFPVAVNDVITAANRQNWIEKLLIELLRARRGEEALVAFAQRFHITPAPADAADESP